MHRLVPGLWHRIRSRGAHLNSMIPVFIMASVGGRADIGADRAHGGNSTQAATRLIASSRRIPMTASRSAPLRALRSLFATVALGAGVMVALSAVPAAQSDLDTFMQQVLERRDANWKKLSAVHPRRARSSLKMRGPAGHAAMGRTTRLRVVRARRLLRPESRSR